MKIGIANILISFFPLSAYVCVCVCIIETIINIQFSVLMLSLQNIKTTKMPGLPWRYSG